MTMAPTAQQLLQAVAEWLRDGNASTSRFDRAVAASALDTVRRELDLAPASNAAASERTAALLGRPGTHADLAAAIRTGTISDEDPALRAHLRALALEALAIDQPRYRHELDTRL